MTNLLHELYRIPPEVLSLEEAPGGSSGFFRVEETTVWGPAGELPTATKFTEAPDASNWLSANGDRALRSSFSPTAVANALRREQYTGPAPTFDVVHKLYHYVRPALPVPFRRPLQRWRLRRRQHEIFPAWPVDTTVEDLARTVLAESMRRAGLDRVPFIWFWPEGYPTCTIVTHDVETAKGLDAIESLVELDRHHGIPSSAHFIREGRYRAPESLIAHLKERGVEINVHGFNHDGRLFSSERIFNQRAPAINEYGRRLGARGFRSPVMYRIPDWIDRLDFEYDMSIPNVARLDPQPGGCCTVFPFRLGRLLELPLTTAQDYALFNLIGETSTRTWKEQIRIIRKYNGLLSFNTHPDYLQTDSRQAVYRELLTLLRELSDAGETWLALPGQLNDWWRLREGLTLRIGPTVRIEPECAEARVAWACLDGDSLVYELEQPVAG